MVAPNQPYVATDSSHIKESYTKIFFKLDYASILLDIHQFHQQVAYTSIVAVLGNRQLTSTVDQHYHAQSSMYGQPNDNQPTKYETVTKLKLERL